MISVWDTAGQERFDSLTKLYYNGASAALVCIDLTDGSSFSKAQFWVSHAAAILEILVNCLQGCLENDCGLPGNKILGRHVLVSIVKMADSL